MNWSYLAGFFDGEGSLTQNGNKGPAGSISYKVSIPQARSRKVVLDQIQIFLATHDVVSRIYEKHWNPPRPNSEDIFCLHVCDRKSLMIVLKNILPFVVAKKTAVQDTWRFLTMSPNLRKYAAKVRDYRKAA